MDYNTDKVDDAVLALHYLTRCGDRYGERSWKGQDWNALERLYEKGYIGDPKSKAKSVPLTEEGLARSEELFRKLFGKGD